MNARGARAVLWVALLGPNLCSCIASNVVAEDQRLVARDLTALPFVPADASAFTGLYESIDIRGDAAVALRKIYYVFDTAGSYTGAALAESDGQLSFQTLNGNWTIGPEGLVLDGGAAVQAEMAAQHLRLSTPAGSVVLKAGSLQ